MQVSPSFDNFATAYEAGKAQVVWTTMVADLETPVSAMLKVGDGRPNSFLLESVEGGAVRGRYSIIGLKPDLIWRCFGDRAEINRNALADPDVFDEKSEGALASLRALINDSRIDLPPELPPMAAGLVGYMGYDMVRLMERLPDTNADVLGVPDSMFLRPTIMAIFDTIEDVVIAVTPVRPLAGVDARQAYAGARERLADVIADLERSLPHQRVSAEPAEVPKPTSNTSRAEYHRMVETAKEYIFAGDIFQVVPSQRFAVPFGLPPLALYRALRRLNPSPFLFFLDFGAFAVVGSSPEILVRLRGDTVTIRPIAGTRPRGATAAEDAALADELLADEKERADHLMLLDLGRNDVGRVARIGTVRVTEKMVIERYSHVMHIVSNVEGEIDAGRYDALDAMIGGFPAGTVSGAPKIRAMEIIDELEREKRGVYAGAVGYFSANGSMDTCIVLRTALVKDGVMHVQAGAGIVADSDPDAEHRECQNKAMALIRAAEEAVRYGGGR
jgi:anthranilate synthase component 1